MKNKIKFPFGSPWITSKEISTVNKVLKSKILVHGQHTANFEKNFKQFTKAKHAIAVSSCTAGMHLFYYSVGIGMGDEVIIPAQTHLATAHAIELTGAKAVFIDSSLDTGNIDIEKIESKITKKTKAICVVHYLGLPVDIKKIKYLAKKHDLYIVEDCALALGAKYFNKHVGTIGDVGVFSFYPVKHITTAEGGMVILNNKKLATKIKLLRAFGVNKNFNQRKLPGIYDCEYLGFNYRMSEIHAAIGIEQLKKLPIILKKRKILFLKYLENMKMIKDIQVLQSKKIKNLNSSFYSLSFLLNKDLSKKRSNIIKFLNSNGIGTSIYYPHPVPRIKYYRNKYKYNQKNFLNAQKISDDSISVSVSPYLSKADIDYICEKIKLAIKKYKKK
jgi:dTDP-4-amino-4,6-dideoxygalactose transaminase